MRIHHSNTTRTDPLKRLLKTSDYFPQIIGTFSKLSISINIQVWEITGGDNLFINTVSNECYTIGDTGRWGWSTVNLPLSKNKLAHYFYLMTSNIDETFDGQFVINISENSKWICQKNNEHYLKLMHSRGKE